MYLLDTDTCISVLKQRSGVAERFAKQGPSTIFLSAISYHELLYGALHSDAVDRHLRLVEHFVAPLTILPFTRQSAIHSSRIKQDLSARGQRIGPMDTLIAAHGLEHELIVVTGNLSEFRRVDGLHVEDWN